MLKRKNMMLVLNELISGMSLGVRTYKHGAGAREIIVWP